MNITPVNFTGILPAELQQLVRCVDSDATDYRGRNTDVKLLERYLASGDHRTAAYLAGQMNEFQRQFRQMQDHGLPLNIKSLIDQVHSGSVDYPGRDIDLSLLMKYEEGGDFGTLTYPYQAKLVIERQANLRARVTS